MKKFNVTSRISSKAKSEIERILSTHAEYSKSYFFHPDSTSGGRRRNESNFLKLNPNVTFISGSKTIEVYMTYSESCSNVYYSAKILVNGEKANLAAVKKLLK